MKKGLLIAACAVLFSNYIFGQTLKEKVIVKAVTVLSEKTYKLNGGARASVGGESRKIIPVSLPPNTVEWYYSITSSPDGSTFSDRLNLAVQIAAAIATNTTAAGKAVAFTGLDQVIIDAIKIPTGSMPVNAYVMDNVEAVKFSNKQKFSYAKADENLLQGTTKMEHVMINSGSPYIGIQNPSTWSALNFKIEVVAITVEKKWVLE